MNNDLIKYIHTLSDRDTKDLNGKSLKTAEEVGELAKKVLAFTQSAGSLHRIVAKENVLEECADVMLCALSIVRHLGFDMEELDEMLMTKAQKWDNLQQRELGTKYPLPYEIHVTVRSNNINDFQRVCDRVGVKPIVLALQDRDQETKIQDVMTSSIHLGNDVTAMEEMRRIAECLKGEGCWIERTKIETVPWHPAAPSEVSGVFTIPTGTYFESHLNILVKSENEAERLNHRALLKEIAEHHDAHLSTNVFKVYSDSEYTIMMTLRSYIVQREQFETMRDELAKAVVSCGFEVEKVITEFALFDSKQNHDILWLTNK